MCGYAFERPGQLAEAGGKCPSCGVFLEIPARGVPSVPADDMVARVARMVGLRA